MELLDKIINNRNEYSITQALNDSKLIVTPNINIYGNKIKIYLLKVDDNKYELDDGFYVHNKLLDKDINIENRTLNIFDNLRELEDCYNVHRLDNLYYKVAYIENLSKAINDFSMFIGQATHLAHNYKKKFAYNQIGLKEVVDNVVKTYTKDRIDDYIIGGKYIFSNTFIANNNKVILNKVLDVQNESDNFRRGYDYHYLTKKSMINGKHTKIIILDKNYCAYSDETFEMLNFVADDIYDFSQKIEHERFLENLAKEKAKAYQEDSLTLF